MRKSSGPIAGAWPNCRRDLHAACDRAKIPHCSPNDLRRTFASWLKQRGVDSGVVARLLGHTSTKMVDFVYGKLDLETLARAVALLGGTRAGQTPAASTDTTDNHWQLTDCESRRCAMKPLCSDPESNQGHADFQSAALPAELSER